MTGEASVRHGLIAILLLPLVLHAQPLQLFDAPTHLRFSAQEVGEAARRQVDTEVSAMTACHDTCARVRAVWQRLLPAALQQPRGAVTLQLAVVGAGTSAQAAADGRILFPAALVDELQLSDAEIAFVLAHEAIHVLLEHEREVLTGVDTLLRSDVKRTAADIYAALQFDLGLSLKMGFLMQAAELEADNFGLQLAALAGFDPAQQVTALEKLLRPSDSARQVLHTHPTADERLRRIREALPVAQAIYAASRAPAPVVAATSR